MAADPVPPPPPEEYRGGVLRMLFPRLDLVELALPGSPVHGHTFAAPNARLLVDWWVDTGGDMARWPFPWVRYGPPRALEAPRAPQPPPPPQATGKPTSPPLLTRNRGKRVVDVGRDADGRLVF